ncbi:MAG: ATP-dependent zinc protease [Opitutales bacterium]|nr:ATP-dependent zinc protease [Opitutales bacterium]
MTGHVTIGWKESIALPGWGIDAMTAKLDTGARGSAIDVARIEMLDGNRVRFDVILDRGAATRFRTVEAEIAGEVRVRSSNGIMQRRVRVRTGVLLGGVLKETEFSLVSRKRMIHRVLLGRRFMGGTFFVDSSRRYVLGKPTAAKNKAKTRKHP